MGSGGDDIDISMSEIKGLSQDVHSFMHALATRLDSALPEGMVRITKKKKLFSSRETVNSITINLKDKTFLISLEDDHLVTTINKQVNNIVLSHDKCPVPQWFSCLKEELRVVAEYHKDAADVLSDFLI